MTELTIRPEDIRDAIARNVESYAPGTTREEVGRVTETGHGIARVEGLHSAMTNELLEFEGGLLGLALNLDVREIGTVLLGEGSRIDTLFAAVVPAGTTPGTVTPATGTEVTDPLTVSPLAGTDLAILWTRYSAPEAAKASAYRSITWDEAGRAVTERP